MANKQPDWCWNNCPMAYTATGFVPDHVPSNPKLALILARPESDDATDGAVLSSGYGRFFYAAFMKPLGLNAGDVLVSHVLRCHKRQFPTGRDKITACRACRHWDGARASYDDNKPEFVNKSIEDWNPNIYLATFDIKDMLSTGAYQALGLADMRKALRFAAEGHRPAVIFGSEALFTIAPWLDGSGGIKNWRGHWWQGSWKWQTTLSESARTVTYKKPKADLWVRKKRAGVPDIIQESLFTQETFENE